MVSVCGTCAVPLHAQRLPIPLPAPRHQEKEALRYLRRKLSRHSVKAMHPYPLVDHKRSLLRLLPLGSWIGLDIRDLAGLALRLCFLWLLLDLEVSKIRWEWSASHNELERVGHLGSHARREVLLPVDRRKVRANLVNFVARTR